MQRAKSQIGRKFSKDKGTTPLLKKKKKKKYQSGNQDCLPENILSHGSENGKGNGD